MADQYGKIKIGSKEYITSTGTTTTPNLAYYDKGKKYKVMLASGKSSGDVNVNISGSPYHFESFDLPNVIITKAAGESTFKASLESGTTASTFGNKSIGLYITEGSTLPSDKTAITLASVASSQPATIPGATTSSTAQYFYLHVLASVNAATSTTSISTNVWDKATTGTPMGSLLVSRLSLGSIKTSDEFNASITPIVNTSTVSITSSPVEATVIVEKDEDDKWSIRCTDYNLNGNETKIDLDSIYVKPGSSASGTQKGESPVTVRQFFNGTPYKRSDANKDITSFSIGTSLNTATATPSSLTLDTPTQVQIQSWPLIYYDCFRNV